ncbi:hypothetical protein RF11_06168 [Thelohanellus kitauei]|uniref:Uncharacterized protein n=1 Tax=Thelohanellus kitauei TaxID=669202 RepID=A0A0C2IEF1_THEKT|nr:hypothetical protein RF11_06168 [Thelohanellus kitauei]
MSIIYPQQSQIQGQVNTLRPVEYTQPSIRSMPIPRRRKQQKTLSKIERRNDDEPSNEEPSNEEPSEEEPTEDSESVSVKRKPMPAKGAAGPKAARGKPMPPKRGARPSAPQRSTGMRRRASSRR